MECSAPTGGAEHRQRVAGLHRQRYVADDGCIGPIAFMDLRELKYLPAPPTADNVEPQGPAPSPDTIWVSPCMYWVEGQYVQRAGYWLAAQPNWVWCRLIAQRVIRQAQPGAIILLHDGLETRARPQAQNMVAALPIIIGTLQAQGYRFVTVPELLDIQKATGGDVP